MRIELASLERSKQFAHVYAPGELLLSEERMRLVDFPAVSGEIWRDERAVNVSGKLTAVLQVECDRCLKFVEFPVNATFKVQYIPPEEDKAEPAVELTEEDLDFAVFAGDAIDVDELVAEELLLAVPAHVLCKDDCKGLCLACGSDKNTVDCGCATAEVDPRWAGLKEIMNRES
ncbi:MAG: DUF177 domain-containing protein [Pyrinomonadaceae bacterium]